MALLVVAAAPTHAAGFEVGRNERLLVIAPHPDDETLGAGGLIQRVVERGGSARVVLMTAGDGYVEGVIQETGRPRPRPEAYIAYGERRLGEARAAVRRLAGPAGRVQVLGFPDGGLEPLLAAHWQRRHAERSFTTRLFQPSYPEARDRRLAYDGADLLHELVALLREAQPTIVALPDPLDRHPDHRATGLFALLAVDEWLRAGAPGPQLLAYLVHWPAWPPGWDRPPSPDDARARLDLPPTLPARGAGPVTLALDDHEVQRKQAALARHATQQEAMPFFLAAFVRRTEPYTSLRSDDIGSVLAQVMPSIVGAPARHDHD